MANSLSSLFIGAILIIIVSTVFYVMIIEGSAEYGVNFNETYKQNFDEINGTLGIISNLTETFGSNVEDSAGFQGGSDIRIDQKIVAAIKLPKNMISVYSTMMTSFASTIGVPAWIITAFILMIFVVIFSLIIGAILRKDIN